MSQSLLVLVVDDDPAIRKAVRIGVEELGWQASEASDGAEALHELNKTPFDLVVSDVWMPNVDGIAFVKEALDLRPGLKVLAISGGGTAPATLSLKMLEMYGATDMLYKPFTNDELKEKLLELFRLVATDETPS